MTQSGFVTALSCSPHRPQKSADEEALVEDVLRRLASRHPVRPEVVCEQGAWGGPGQGTRPHTKRQMREFHPLHLPAE